ncbi:MAG: glucose-6-phosphate isomerase, partial [Deltaproteobacteria bacterium]|nr:glucose-6-phosphate isomerase [Deltaproteobacteria bacterium]
MSELTKSPAWKALQKHHQIIKDVHMRDLFAQDEHRFEKFSLHFNDLLFDYSKHRITGETVQLLTDLAGQTGLQEKIARMFAGEKINTTEQRPVLHIALRNRSNRPICVD